MIDISKEVVEQLETILPAYYELFLDSKSAVPCISYQQIENNEVSTANINGYSRIAFKIKVWARTVEDIVTYSEQIDDKLATLGEFNRRSVNELSYNNLICRVMDYEILMNEIYETGR